MAKVMVQVVSGPEHATRAALGFLVAKGAVDEGHDVTFFLAADGVQFLHESVRNAIAGLGGGKVADDFETIRSGAKKMYASKMSMGARGVADDAASSLNVEFGTPAILVKEALEADTVLVY